MSEQNGSQPVTRAELRTELGQLEHNMLEAMERMETRLLTAFHDWARTYTSQKLAE